MTTHTDRPVIAGVDGSDSALEAVRWAARQALAWRCPLRLVHAESWPWPTVVNGIPVPAGQQDAVRAAADGWLRDATAAATTAAPGVEVTAETVTAPAVQLLADRSSDARLVVVGSRGLGGLARLMLGSVAGGLATHARCPVAVVRWAGATRRNGTGPVIAGVDGTPASEAVLEFAFDQAAWRGVSLVAVHAWSDAPFLAAAASAAATPGTTWPDLEAVEQQVLTDALTGWQQKYPEVEVHPVVTEITPAQGIVDAAADAQLIVVGNRGRGGFRELLLGSVSHALVQHAPCPVVVVRPRR